jgi:hypothetical protein
MKKALVLSLAAVLALGVVSFAQTLSGYWISEITIAPQTPEFTAFDSEIFVDYSIAGWSFNSLSVIDMTGWIDQEFGFSGALGAFTLGGTLDFTPMPGAFDYLLVDGGVTLAGIEFGFTWLLEDQDLGLEITGSGVAGAVEIDVAVTFGDIDVVPTEEDIYALYDHVGNDICDLNWNGIAIDITFPFCCAEITGSVAFDCDGFVSACFSVYNILIPNFPWLDIDAKVCFERVGTEPDWIYDKNFYLKPGLTIGTIACFNLYTYLNWLTAGADGWGPADDYITIGDLRIRGIGLTCEIGGVTFKGLTWLQESTAPGSRPGILAGTSYYEAYQIATTDDACCGPFSFDLTAYFNKNDATGVLFDLAEFVANVSYELGENFTFMTGITVETGVGFTEWSLGFEVTW